MPTIQKFLLSLVFCGAFFSLSGCGEKQTVKTAKDTSKTSSRMPAPPPGP